MSSVFIGRFFGPVTIYGKALTPPEAKNTEAPAFPIGRYFLLQSTALIVQLSDFSHHRFYKRTDRLGAEIEFYPGRSEQLGQWP